MITSAYDSMFPAMKNASYLPSDQAFGVVSDVQQGYYEQLEHDRWYFCQLKPMKDPCSTAFLEMPAGSQTFDVACGFNWVPSLVHNITTVTERGGGNDAPNMTGTVSYR